MPRPAPYCTLPRYPQRRPAPLILLAAHVSKYFMLQTDSYLFVDTALGRAVRHLPGFCQSLDGSNFGGTSKPFSFQLLEETKGVKLQLRVSSRRNLESAMTGMYRSCSAERELVALLSHVKQSTGYRGLGDKFSVLEPAGTLPFLSSPPPAEMGVITPLGPESHPGHPAAPLPPQQLGPPRFLLP